jgi:hypothetical protein
VIHDQAAEASLEMPAAFLQEMTRSKQASKKMSKLQWWVSGIFKLQLGRIDCRASLVYSERQLRSESRLAAVAW